MSISHRQVTDLKETSTGDGSGRKHRRVTALEGVPKMFCFSKNFGEGEEPAGPVEKSRRENQLRDFMV